MTDHHLTLPALVLAALVGAPLIGLAGDHLVGDAAAREGQAAEAKALATTLAARGWAPAAGRPAAQLAARDVTLLVATRPFEIDLAHGALRGGAPSPEARERAARVVAAELGRYAPGWLAKAGLARVALVGDLTEDGAPIPSLPNHLQTLVIDVGVGEAYLARLVHHEVFHFFDRASRTRLSPDPEWDGANPPGFTYGAGGRSMRSPWASERRVDLPGFVTSYATSGVEEDKAETFALAMTDPGVRRQAEEDPTLAKKLALAESRLAAFGAMPEGLAGERRPR